VAKKVEESFLNLKENLRIITEGMDEKSRKEVARLVLEVLESETT
jgi:hypothetical protein